MADKLLRQEFGYIKETLMGLQKDVKERLDSLAATLTNVSTTLTVQTDKVADIKARLDNVQASYPREIEKITQQFNDSIKQTNTIVTEHEEKLNKLEGSASAIKWFAVIVGIVNGLLAIIGVFVNR